MTRVVAAAARDSCRVRWSGKGWEPVMRVSWKGGGGDVRRGVRAPDKSTIQAWALLALVGAARPFAGMIDGAMAAHRTGARAGRGNRKGSSNVRRPLCPEGGHGRIPGGHRLGALPPRGDERRRDTSARD